MKKYVDRFVTPVFALLLVLLLAIPLFAASPAVSLTGPSEVRAGDTIQITLRLNGKGISSMLCDLSFDASQGSVTQVKQLIASPWTLAVEGNRVICYDDQVKVPINADTALFAVSFRLRSDLPAGTVVKFGTRSAYCSDGEKDLNLSDANYSVTLLPPRSSDATLKSLTAENAELTPAFSPDRTEYSASVPYSEKTLKLVPVPADKNASCKISGNSLSVGTNKVTVRVTAENGSTKTYTVTVVREQDPNYVPGGDASLRTLTVSSGILSPAFSKGVTGYVVYLPYEITSLTLSGTPNDSKGTCTPVTAALSEGKNVLQIKGVAENGSEEVYTVYVMRMPAFDGDPEKLIPTETEPAQTEPTETEPVVTEPAETVPVTEPEQTEEAAAATSGSAETDEPDESGKETDQPKQTERSDKTQTILLSVLIALGILIAVLLAANLIRKKKES